MIGGLTSEVLDDKMEVVHAPSSWAILGLVWCRGKRVGAGSPCHGRSN